MGSAFCNALKEARGIKVDGIYYADSYRDNIYHGQMDERHIRMFCRGEGKELLPKDGKKEKAAAIHSSSMLSYNFFSWISKDQPLILDGIKYDKVVFEEQFRVLATRNNRANLDVVLVSEDNSTVRLFESKFTEQLDGKCSLQSISDAYYDEKSYFEGVDGKAWVEVFNSLKGLPDGKKKEYFDGLKQVACHLIGISSMMKNEYARKWFNNNSWLRHALSLDPLNGDEQYIFQSLVFCPCTENEKELTHNYIALNKEFVSGIKGLPTNLSVKDSVITYRQLWKSGMEASIKDPELKAYLEAYLQAHE